MVLKKSIGKKTNKINSINRDIKDEGYQPYELITLILEDGTAQTGWFTGNGWDSLRQIKSEPVFWRKKLL